MSTTELPDDVARFLAVTRLRIPHVETILLLRANRGENWDSTRLSARLYVSRAGARSVLRALEGLRIVVEDPMVAGSFRLAALDPELDHALTRLEYVYATNLVAITRYVHSLEASGAQAFADAFDLRKDSK